jgi:hypothetical protein
MMLRNLKIGCIAAASLLGLAFGASPAAAGGCGYSSCGAGYVKYVLVTVPVYRSSCGCGSWTYSYAYVPVYYAKRWRYRHRHHWDD